MSGHGHAMAWLQETLHHIERVLPAQAPIRDFVHHNTLHGFQHLPFREALAEARRRIGVRAFLPQAEFREQYRRGRVSTGDLHAALAAVPELAADEPLVAAADASLRRREVYLAALLHPIGPVSRARLHWGMEELDVLRRLQADLPADARERLLSAAQAPEPEAVSDLWSACLELLGLVYEQIHPEELLDSDAELAPRLESAGGADADLAGEAEGLLASLLARVGEDRTLGGLLRALTGEDLMSRIQPLLVRHLAAHLDQGMAAWHNPLRESGFYAAWRASAERDPVWGLIDLPEWKPLAAELPDDAARAILQQLQALGLAKEKWPRYLERLALELPGWSGMFLWRHLRPGYGDAPAAVPVDMADYLAVRLVLERVFAAGICRRRWDIEPGLPAIAAYFRDHPAQLLVRHSLHNERLPEYLVARARHLTELATFSLGHGGDGEWQALARSIHAWHASPAADPAPRRTAQNAAWPLFRLAQHLGLAAPELRALGREGAEAMLDCLARLDEDAAGWVWLLAYERHYREHIFGALLANHGRSVRRGAPEAQLVFCMDDREEGMRRHLEELNPSLETFGAAGFFGVAMHWQGLDDRSSSALCPVVVTPAHRVTEVARPGAERQAERHARRRSLRLAWKRRLVEGTRRGLLAPGLLSALAAPLALLTLAGKVLAPAATGRLAGRLGARFDTPVPSAAAFGAPPESPPATPEQPRAGFTDTEQADRVQGLLRTIGLTRGFAPLVALLGHGSTSLNNPHQAAYDCGACAGRHGGPNARVFAAMANRPEVRAILAERGLAIPQQTWFVGGERNTGEDTQLWYDEDAVPAALKPALAGLSAQLDHAAREHSRERCRRFASAPPAPDPQRAHRHVAARSRDFSQPRPELGHVTNACAFIGRRTMSRGAFFDRRAFLISYDPTQDPEGRVLEAILLAAGPVGAGISLEYYFSTVNNDRLGCGTKVVHNVAGLLGVMEGAGSDLRTGLPRQMIEIHEAMRLLLVVEHSTEVLSAIYGRQPVVRELVANGWVQLAAKSPDAARIDLFDPGEGWLPWQPAADAPPTVERSAHWYAGHTEALPPALLTRPVETAA